MDFDLYAIKADAPVSFSCELHNHETLNPEFTKSAYLLCALRQRDISPQTTSNADFFISIKVVAKPN